MIRNIEINAATTTSTRMIGAYVMKAKPRWMKSLLKTAESKSPMPPIPKRPRKLHRVAVARPA